MGASSSSSGPKVRAYGRGALAVFAGAVLVVDLRFMGTGLTREPLAEVAEQARPWLIGGFWALVVTGIMQLSLQPVKEYYSDMFNFKMKVMLVAIIFSIGSNSGPGSIIVMNWASRGRPSIR